MYKQCKIPSLYFATVILNNNYVVTGTNVFKWVFIVSEVEPIVNFGTKKWFIRFIREQKKTWQTSDFFLINLKLFLLKYFATKNKWKVRLKTCFDTIA